MGTDARLGLMIREEMPTLGAEDLTYDPRLGEDAVTAEDPPRSFRSWELTGSKRLIAEDMATRSPRRVSEDAPTESSSPSLAPIAIELQSNQPSNPPHPIDVWFGETPVRTFAPGSRTTMRTRQPSLRGLSLDAQRGTAAFVGAFGAVAMAVFIWGISAIAAGPDSAQANNASIVAAPAESWVIPVMDLPVLAKAAESRAVRAQR